MLTKPLSEFNIEHVFPDTLGGVITSKLFCETCNTEFNQKVDEPFVKSKYAIPYRESLNLKKQNNRKVPPLFRGTIKDPEGNERVVRFADGKITSEFVDQFSYEIQDDGRIKCQLIIDASKLDKQDEIIQQRLKGLSKKLNTDLTKGYTVVSVDRKQHPPFNHTEMIKSVLFVKQCVKIAYEMACMAQSNYPDDPTAKKLLSFLLADEPYDEFTSFFDLIYESKEEFYLKWFALLSLQSHQHAVLIENVKGEGVFMAVKIFDYVYPIKITDNESLFPPQEFLCVNDAVAGTVFTSHVLIFQPVNFQLEFANVPEEVKVTIQTEKESAFITYQGSLVFFRADGSVRYNSVNEMCYSMQHKEHIEFKIGEINDIELIGKKIFFKTSSGSLVHILRFTVRPMIAIMPLPKVPQNV